jgi:hypothetical protein
MQAVRWTKEKRPAMDRALDLSKPKGGWRT